MRLLLLALLVPSQDAASDEAARAALRRLAEKFRDLRTLSGAVAQERRTSLLEEPIRSSGTMFYRRDPGRLVFRMTEPRVTEIHMDRSAYQVYRPDEKRLERIEFADDALTGRLLMVFQPKEEEVGKAFAIRAGTRNEGEIDVRLDPLDERVRRRLKRLVLTLRETDGALLRILYEEADGDEVRFELKDVRLNPDLPSATFDLDIPEGTRIFRHTPK